MRTWLFVSLLVLAAGSTALAEDAHVVSVAPAKASLNDTITVVVENIDSLAPPDSSGKSPALVPFLNGYALKGSTLEYIDRKTNSLRFSLKRNNSDSTSKDAWNHVLGGLGGTIRHCDLSVGPENGAPIKAKDDKPIKFDLVVFREPWSAIAFFALLALFVVFTVLIVKTDILKDLPNSSGKRTYSLGRCQMAWWFFIILSSFVCIWLVAGDLTFPSSSLILLGISSATALSAVIIDPKPKKPERVNFLENILDDGGGVAFHRFQIFAWTIILGIIFVSKVVGELAQPTLDSTLLTLMGISSGTYLGFKFPEKTS